MFYGWYVVAVCFVAAVFTWGLGVFGASLYLVELTRTGGWPLSLVSGAVTLFYLTNALVLPATGFAIDRLGPRPVVAAGTLLLGLGVVAVGRIELTWQVYAVFACMGLGYSTMSVTGLSATIAPWFERHQGRSVAVALTGASFGAMVAVPILVGAVGWLGFRGATTTAGITMIAVMLPLALVALRFRSPAELGLSRDGDGRAGSSAASVITPPSRPWRSRDALRTAALWSTAGGFALGLLVQVGFLTHHVALAEPWLGLSGAGWLVGATGLTGLLGRLWLARVADRVDVRRYSAGLLATQTLALGLLALWPGSALLIGTSLVYGFCLGQITTLSPIVVRREFGAASFGALYGVAGTVIQLCSAFGPALFGVLRELAGGYSPVLAVAAGLELLALAVVLAGRPRTRPDTA